MPNFNISVAPFLPWPVLAALAAGGIVVIALGLYAGRRGTWLRAVGLVLVLASLTDPSLVREDRQPLKDVVAVVLDRSGSQSIGDRTAQTTQAGVEIQKQLAALGNIDTRVVESSGTDEGDDGTRLFSSLNAALADVPPDRVGGAIMVTDGEVDDIPATAAGLGFKAPLHVFITGHEGEHDRRIELIEAPKFGIVGQDQTITARVLDTDASDDPVDVTVSRDGTKIAEVPTRPGQIFKVPVHIDHGGSNIVELEIPMRPDDLTPINKRAVVTIDGIRDKLKVLLVSGQPHAGERTWRNLLKSDPNVDLVHFTILRPPDKQDNTPINELSLIAFPTSDLFGPKIKDFDLIIFDRYSDQSVLPEVYFQNIVNYVRGGGALLMAVGPDYSGPDGLYYSPLGDISPAKPTGQVMEGAFLPTITSDGAKDPVTRGLAGSQTNPPQWGEWFRQIGATVTRGTSVMSGNGNNPLLVLSREGKGRVALLLSDQIWLWARGFQGGGPQVDLLRRLAHWLMKEPELEEEALRATVSGSNINIERQTLKDTTPPVVVTSPSGKQQTVTLAPGQPGLFDATIPAKELGLYRLSDGILSTLVNVGPDNPREFQDVVSTPDKLAPLAKATGGTVRRIAASGSGAAITLPRFVSMRDSPIYGGSDYVGIKRTGASVVTGIGVAPLAIGFVGLIALFGSVVLGWLYEGRQRKPRVPPPGA